jgi:hypothetical protein
VVRAFAILVVAVALPYWLWRHAKAYGAAEAAACADHCAEVSTQHPGQGGWGALDPEQDVCTCALGEPTEAPGFDRLDGYVPGTVGPERP